MKYQKMELEIQTPDSLLIKKPLEIKFFKHLTRRVQLMMPMKKILPWLILSLKVVLYLNIEGTLYILGQKAHVACFNKQFKLVYMGHFGLKVT